MPNFIFTACNFAGENVTDRIEAENLIQAKRNLESAGYSSIQFYQSELSADVLNTFEQKVIDAEKKASPAVLQQNVQTQYKTGFFYQILFQLKTTAVYWLIIAGAALLIPNFFTYALLGVSLFALVYLNLATFFYNQMMTAYFSLENKKARFWTNVSQYFNYISLFKIPQSELDMRFAALDAREGRIHEGLQRMAKYENDPKVSRRMYNNQIISLYGNAKQFDSAAELLEKTLQEGNVYQEETLDYALCLARRLKQTKLARQVLEKVYDFEITVLSKPFLPFCKGIIELEEGNISQAEFYLKMANDEMKPFAKNHYLIGPKSEIKAFLAIVLAKTGRRDEAQKLFAEAKKYLQAGDDHELLQRCEDALN